MTLFARPAAFRHTRWLSLAALGLAAAFLAAAPAAAQDAPTLSEGAPSDEPTSGADPSDDGSTQSAAQAMDEALEFKPYTGPAILLPEGDAPPPPSVVDTQVIEKNFDDSEIPRFKRGLVRYSDNSVKSDGEAREFFPNGKPFVEGQYEAGKPVGEWTYYHSSGEVAKKITFVNGRPDGEVRVNSADGKLIAVRTYKEGKRHGSWVHYGAEGGDQPVREEVYADGVAEGVWKAWWKNGQLRQVTPFVAGKLEGKAEEWNQLGEKRGEGEFKAGQRHGKTTIYQDGGSVIERLYDEGKLVEQTKRTAEDAS